MLLGKTRYIPYRASTPYENMAIDEYLISYYKETKVPVLRVYSWSPPGISIGKNQNINEINTTKVAEDKVPVVRRITGGGAIFHDKELTYCMVCSENDLSEKNLSVKESFEYLNKFILKMYEKFGLKASYAKDAINNGEFGGREAFCFSASEEYDIIVSGKKIGGNAQSRKKDIIFQHGSIPIVLNDKAVEYMDKPINNENFTSLKEILNREPGVEEVYSNLIASFTETFQIDLMETPLNIEEKKEVVKLMTTKYAGSRWNIDGK